MVGVGQQIGFTTDAPRLRADARFETFEACVNAKCVIACWKSGIASANFAAVLELHGLVECHGRGTRYRTPRDPALDDRFAPHQFDVPNSKWRIRLNVGRTGPPRSAGPSRG